MENEWLFRREGAAAGKGWERRCCDIAQQPREELETSAQLCQAHCTFPHSHTTSLVLKIPSSHQTSDRFVLLSHCQTQNPLLRRSDKFYPRGDKFYPRGDNTHTVPAQKHPLAAPPTLLHHGEMDQPGALEEGPVDLELELAGDVAGVDARVVQGDVQDSDGHVLHVFAPVPLDPTTKAAWKLVVCFPVLVDLWGNGRGFSGSSLPRAQAQGRDSIPLQLRSGML